MLIKRIACLLAVVSLAVPTTALAQRKPPVAPGDRVRVTAPSIGVERLVATVLELRPDTLVVGSREPLVLPFSSLTKLDVSQDRTSRAGTGFLVGVVGGALTGAVIGVAKYDWGKPSIGVDFNDLQPIGFAAAVGAVVGGGIGALIGWTIKVDQWENVPLARLRMGPSQVTADGVSVSISVHWSGRR